MSQIGSRATSKTSSRNHDIRVSGSNGSGTSSLAFVRAKEAVRNTELEAEAAVLEKQRSLEEQKLCLQQEQECLTLETELAKSKAKEQVLPSITEAAPCLFVLNAMSLESREDERKVEAPIIGLETKPVRAKGLLTIAVGCSTLNPEAVEWHQRSLVTNRKECADES